MKRAPARLPGLARVALNAWGHRREPISLVHFVTRRCNARCAHCFIDFESPAPETDALSIAEIEAVARRVGSSLVNVNLTGGEPFLHRELWSIVRAWFQGARVESVYITTHGGYPDRVADLAERFLASEIDGRLFVSISIDNFAEAHDRNRRAPGLFARALDSLERLAAFRNARLGAGVSITVAEHNHERVLDLYRHLREAHGVSVVTATLRRGAGVAPPLEPTLARRVGAAYAALTEAISSDLALEPRQGARRSFVARMQDAKDELLYAMLSEDAQRGGRYRSPCRAGGLFLVMQPNGNVEACEVRGDAHLGNIRDFDLDMRALLGSPAARAWRRAILAERCHCTYECARGVSIVASPRYLPRIASGLLRSYRRG